MIALWYYLLAPICQKLSLLRGWAHLHHYPSGLWHICQRPLGLEYLSSINISQLLLTCDDDVLPISARPSKVPEEGAAREHLAARGWKLVWNADVNISSCLPKSVASVEYLNPLNGDWSIVVNGNPWCSLAQGVAHGMIMACGSINAAACWVQSSIPTHCGWLGGIHWFELNSCG